MTALEKITPMFLANAAFCIENGSDVKPETRESIIDTLIKASEELSQANGAKVAALTRTQGADAQPVAIYQVIAGYGVGVYRDCSQEEYERAGERNPFRRIVYTTRDAAPSGNWPFAEIRNILQTLTLLCEENGEPCDGFRFRELVLQARKVLAASAPRGKS